MSAKQLTSALSLLVAVSTVIAEQRAAILPMPNRFSGVQLGMKMGEFVKIRTNANSAWQSSGTVDLAQTNQNLREFYNGCDPIWGTLGPTNAFAGAFGLYEFKEDRLNAIMFGWVGESEKIHRCRNEFIQSCIQVWGSDYERRAITRSQPETNSVAPMLLWKTNGVTAVLVLEDHVGMKQSTSGFGLDIFYASDSEKAALFEREKFEPETINRLFEKIGITSNR